MNASTSVWPRRLRERELVADSKHWLEGRVTLVTGASRGIGAATAEALATAGAHVVLAARNRDALEGVARRVREAGGEALAVPSDVAKVEDVQELFAAVERVGPLSALVCAAAVLNPATFEETNDDIWERTLAVNLTGTFLCCRAAFGAMQETGEGRIVNIASLSGVYATEKFPGLAAYNVSKYGVIGLTEAIAVEGKAVGISAICLSPGAVDTEMLNQANPELLPGLTPADVARLIVSLLDSPFVAASGANIPLFSNA
jgi:NAD(P)-dependent dehydrogenase (short-subunit alcohol dehydrogenase family)